MFRTEDKPRVSVIIPMYNCASLLSDFFQDMKEQSMKDYEMICVIDGATDSTLEVVKQYVADDDRIRYFYKENGGAGSARNYGLDYARGEYVMWIDADDRYSPDLLQEMILAADKFKADIVCCLFDSYDYETGEVRLRGFNKEAFPEDTCVNPSEVLAKRSFSIGGPGPTNKIYRRSFVEENELRYSLTRIANDSKFVYAAMAVAKKVVGVHKVLIHVQRNINPASITSNRGKYTQEVPLIFHDFYQWLKERNLSEPFHDAFCFNYVNGISYNSEFAVNQSFIEAVVHALNEEEPWVSMSPEEVAKVFGACFDIRKMKGAVKELETAIRENRVKPGQNPEAKLEKLKSRLEVIALIKTLSNVRYNRDFDEYKIRRYQEKIEKLKESEQILKQKLKHSEQELYREKNSWNYIIGSIITWLPKRIIYLFK
jgi:glycosyltransferase involved in cell wall biosynthesis